MSFAKKCDRCKSFYEKNYYKGEKLYNHYKDKDDSFYKLEIVTSFKNGYKYDLCDNCLELLDMFLLNKEFKIFKGVK